MKSREIIKCLERDGWVLKRVTGSRHHFTHPFKKGLVTVPHPKREIPNGTLRSIEKQAQIRLIGDER